MAPTSEPNDQRGQASGCLGLEAPIMTPNDVTFTFFSVKRGQPYLVHLVPC